MTCRVRWCAGRKDKCIVYTVQLFDEFDYLVRTRIIPLKATLLYSNGTRCTQDILALSPDSRLSIDCSGTTVIKGTHPHCPSSFLA